MTKISRLEDINVYQDALILTKDIFDLCKNSNLRNEFSLCDQIKRASASVAANIAEGYGRNTKTEFARFLSISLGSANEVIAFLDILRLNYPYLNTVPLRDRYLILCKRIYSFRRSLA